MSSILKALRKLEEEKRGGKLEAPDLRFDQGRAEVASRPLVPLTIGTLLGVIVVGLFFLWPAGPQQKQDLLPGEAREAAAPAVSPSLRLPQTVVETPVVSAPAETSPRTSAPASPETEAAVATTAAATEPAMPRAEPAASQSKSAERSNPAVTAQPAGIVVPHEHPRDAVMLPDGISLLVSEIFYLDEVNSMAVVNDLPVMVGSHVDSAVVSAIHADRVLFEIDGTAYTVLLSQP